jgi:AcrR family transcriptional regulator
MAAIAEEAGVNVDTLYATVGTKPKLFGLLLETALSGVDVAVPVEQREYVKRIRAEPDARRKLAHYAAAVAGFQQLLAPLRKVAMSAAAVDAELVGQWRAMLARRAANMHLLIDDLATTGRLRRSLGPKEAADTVTALASPEVYASLVELSDWKASRYEAWLAETLARLLLDD